MSYFICYGTTRTLGVRFLQGHIRDVHAASDDGLFHLKVPLSEGELQNCF